jgi:hypothetical protein
MRKEVRSQKSEDRSRKSEVGRKRVAAGRWLAAAVVMGLAGAGLAAAPVLAAPPAGSKAAVVANPLAPATLPNWPKKEAGKLTVSGRKLEKPDLRYQLLPRMEDTTEGNAALKYLQACAALPPKPVPGGEEILSEITRNAKLEALDPDDPRLTAALKAFEPALALLREGARCDRVDWQSDIRTKGVAALLPNLGTYRWMAYVLAAKIRVDIKRGNWAAAQDELQTGYMLARHMGEGDTLIESLVGIAMAANMNSCVEDWVSMPGSPNLYWPLTNLPAPFNDMRHALATERAFVEFSLPQFRKLRAGEYTVENWNGMMAGLRSLGELNVNERAAQLLGPGAAVAMYPQAKAYLKDRGFSAEAVEKMPVVEAVGRYFVQSFDEDEDDLFKLMGLAPAQRVAGLKQWEKEVQDRRTAKGTPKEGNILAQVMLPALGRVTQTTARLDRQVAALRIVEALRAYAGEKGELPASLDALALPVPADPLGGAFTYERRGDTAVVSSPEQEKKADTVRYEITLRK